MTITPALRPEFERLRSRAEKLHYKLDSIRDLIAWRLRCHVFAAGAADFTDLADVALAAIEEGKRLNLPEHHK